MQLCKRSGSIALRFLCCFELVFATTLVGGAIHLISRIPHGHRVSRGAFYVRLRFDASRAVRSIRHPFDCFFSTARIQVVKMPTHPRLDTSLVRASGRVLPERIFSIIQRELGGVQRHSGLAACKGCTLVARAASRTCAGTAIRDLRVQASRSSVKRRLFFAAEARGNATFPRSSPFF